MQNKGKKALNYLKRFWDYMWKEDSIGSWITVIIVAVIVIRFILYPVLGLVMGTTLPVVAVISESMEHPYGEDWMKQDPAVCSYGVCSQRDWYIENNISEVKFMEFPFSSGFNKGDLMVLIGKNPEDIKIGDVIVFSRDAGPPIIHRVIKIYEENDKVYYETKGDNNRDQITNIAEGFNEKRIPQNNVQGVTIARIPLLGWVKVGAQEGIGWLIRLF